MSPGALKWAYGWPCQFPSEKAVLNLLADRYNEQNLCAWPSVTSIAISTGLSPRTVKRAIRGLEAQGLVEVVGMVRVGTRVRVANIYRLPFITEAPAVVPYPDWSPADVRVITDGAVVAPPR